MYLEKVADDHSNACDSGSTQIPLLRWDGWRASTSMLKIKEPFKAVKYTQNYAQCIMTIIAGYRWTDAALHGLVMGRQSP